MMSRRRLRPLLLAALMACAGCAAHLSPDPPGLRGLHVRIEGSDGLHGCSFNGNDLVPGHPSPYNSAVTVELGEAADEHIRSAIGEVFQVEDTDSPRGADLIAKPRIDAARASRRGWMFGPVDAQITYGVSFSTPSGEEIADVKGTGMGEFGYFALVNVGRALFHLGTLFLFSGLDEHHDYAKAFRTAERSAEEGLVASLQASPELTSYARELASGHPAVSRDARLNHLIDSVIAGRSLAVAILDLEPLSGTPTSLESYLAEELRRRFAQRPGVRTFERAFLAQALKELQLDMTDLVDPEHARRLGRLLAADAILTGTTVRFPHEVKLNLRLLDTETGHVIGAGSALLRMGPDFPLQGDGASYAACAL